MHLIRNLLIYVLLILLRSMIELFFCCGCSIIHALGSDFCSLYSLNCAFQPRVSAIISHGEPPRKCFLWVSW